MLSFTWCSILNIKFFKNGNNFRSVSKFAAINFKHNQIDFGSTTSEDAPPLNLPTNTLFYQHIVNWYNYV